MSQSGEIHLYPENGVWMAEHTGPLGAHVRELFGDSAIPTAFADCCDEVDVVSRIAARNPNADILSPHYSVVR
jgi:hypothetical protein